jgi:hypothetical protein
MIKESFSQEVKGGNKMSEETKSLDQKVVDEITEEHSIEKRGLVAVESEHDGSRKYIDMKQGDRATPTTQVYGNKP